MRNKREEWVRTMLHELHYMRTHFKIRFAAIIIIIWHNIIPFLSLLVRKVSNHWPTEYFPLHRTQILATNAKLYNALQIHIYEPRMHKTLWKSAEQSVCHCWHFRKAKVWKIWSTSPKLIWHIKKAYNVHIVVLWRSFIVSVRKI